MKNLLVVVDYQTDFVTGALGFAQAQALEKGIAEKVRQHLAQGGFVIFTKDTHTQDYLNTPEGKFLPVAHCIKDTEGHKLYGSLSAYEETADFSVRIIEKNNFGSAALAEEACALLNGTPDSIELCGVVTNICVISNAILLQTAFPNATLTVHANLCAAVGSAHQEALSIMAGLGMHIV
ncbi:MAG: isochorismatase family protein [Oscillospiraceae bacterium]|nr:isochorismatase family protein [Oscillospiraceae bacterium]